MASFFGVLQPPPDLPGGLNELINDATSKYLSEPDWGAFITISDRVKAFNVEQMKDVVTVLKLRVGSSSRQTQLLSIHLAESLSKNCGMTFLRCLGDQEFMAQLKKVAEDTRKAKDSLSRAVNKQLLDLIQIWGEEFLTLQERFGLHGFVALYHELRAKGHPFSLPQLDESRPPIFTPPAAHSPGARRAAPAPAPSASSGGSSSPAPQAPLHFPQVREARHLEGQAMVLRNSANMVAEMLQAAKTAQDVKDNDVLREMLQELASAVPQLQNSLEASLERPQLAEELFNLNDDILIAAQLYKHMRKHGAPAVAPAPAAASGAQEPAEAAPADEDLLGAFASNSNTHTESEQATLSPHSRRHASVSHVRGGAVEGTGRGVHPADDPFAAQGSGAGLVGASAATKGSDLASNITPTAGSRSSASGAFDPFASSASTQPGATSGTARDAPAGGLKSSIVIDAPGTGKASTRRTRVRSGGRGGLRPPPTSSRTRAGSSQAVDSAVGIDDDLLGGFQAPGGAPAPSPAPAPAPASAAAADPFAGLAAPAPQPASAAPAAAPVSDLDGLFSSQPSQVPATSTQSGNTKKDQSNNPFDDFF